MAYGVAGVNGAGAICVDSITCARSISFCGTRGLLSYASSPAVKSLPDFSVAPRAGSSTTAASVALMNGVPTPPKLLRKPSWRNEKPRRPAQPELVAGSCPQMKNSSLWVNFFMAFLSKVAIAIAAFEPLPSAS